MGELEEIKYKTNFLKAVIFRLDFSPILVVAHELNPSFQEALRADFPKLEEQTAKTFEIKIERGEKTDSSSDEFKVWSFFDKDKTIKITIAYTYFAVEFFKYVHFEHFREITEKVFSIFLTSYKPVDWKRLGLRYTNQIAFNEGHPLEWSPFINSSLTYGIENFIDNNKSDLSRAMSQFIMNRDDHQLMFSFGVYNGDEFPSRISRKEFILDYDCSTTHFEEHEILSKLDSFHTDILRLFNNSITDDMRTIMGKM